MLLHKIYIKDIIYKIYFTFLVAKHLIFLLEFECHYLVLLLQTLNFGGFIDKCNEFQVSETSFSLILKKANAKTVPVNKSTK